MWAWLMTSASSAAGSNGNDSWLRRSASGLPWIRPQSSSSLRPAASTSCSEPVTSPAAPWKCTRIAASFADSGDRRNLAWALAGSVIAGRPHHDKRGHNCRLPALPPVPRSPPMTKPLLSTALAAVLASGTIHAAEHIDLLVRDATVIDVVDGKRHPHQAIAVRDARIV